MRCVGVANDLWADAVTGHDDDNDNGNGVDDWCIFGARLSRPAALGRFLAIIDACREVSARRRRSGVRAFFLHRLKCDHDLNSNWARINDPIIPVARWRDGAV